MNPVGWPAHLESVPVLSIRPALPGDTALLKTLIHEFAQFEHDQARITEEELLRDGFGSQPKFRALIAEWDAQPAGYAVFFDCYSTFRGPGLFLEDIYIRPKYRGKSIGKALLARIATIACEAGCFGVVFNVMNWNRPAIDFYKKLGASFWDEWKVLCLEEPALRALAQENT